MKLCVGTANGESNNPVWWIFEINQREKKISEKKTIGEQRIQSLKRKTINDERFGILKRLPYLLLGTQ